MDPDPDTLTMERRTACRTDSAASGNLDASNSGSPGSTSRLLCLPAELRAQIFTFVLEDVRCRRPLVVWDGVCVGMSGLKHPKATAILHACRTTYDDSISILYDHTVVDVCIRADTSDDSFPRFQSSLGSIEDCPLLQKLRHIQLEIAYRYNLGTVARVRDRVGRLATACGRLKTIDLVFFDQSHTSMRGFGYADEIVKAATKLVCEKFIDIKRNFAAKKGMNSMHWRALKSRIDAGTEIDETHEQFRELSLSYFEHELDQRTGIAG